VSDQELGNREEPGSPGRGAPGSPWRRPLVLVGVVLLLVIAGWAGARTVQALFKTKGNLARMAGVSLQVKIAQVTTEDIQEVIGGTTLGEGFERVSIINVVSEGKVLAVKTDLGQLVKPGDVMLEFDVNVFQQVLDRAKLAVAAARADLAKLQGAVASLRQRLVSARTTEDTTRLTYERIKVLYDKKVSALAELEQAQVKRDEATSGLAGVQQDLLRAEDALKNEALVIQALMDAARARLGLSLQDLAKAEKDMKNTTVPAPRTGVVSERKVSPGEWVKQAQALFLVDQIEPVYAVAQIEQEKSAYVAVGQDAETIFDSYPTRIHRGRIAKIDPTVDSTRRTFKAYVLLANPSLELRPGMAAFTRLKSARRVTLVPRLAVLNPTGAPSIDASVFVVENSRALIRKVKLGKSEGLERVEVLDGLREGEWVVIYGNRELKNGDLVDPEKVLAVKGAKNGKAR